MVSHLRGTEPSFSFRAQGFGKGTMRWHIPTPGTFEITAHDQAGRLLRSHTVSTPSTVLKITLDIQAHDPIEITVTSG